MHSLWSGVLARQVFVPRPPIELDPAYVQLLADTVEQHSAELAAVIVEPVVQGAGGMRFHDPRYLRVLREITSAHDVLLIFDEIATGFGRTGELFAADHAGVSPDVMCVGKALTGGYLTMAAALCTSRVAEGISGGQVPVLAHGPTFMANPLACAVALASTDLLADGAWRADVARIEAGLAEGLKAASGMPGVKDVRVLGTIGVVQLDRPVDVASATRAAIDRGVWLRPFRDLVYTMPPYVTDDDEIASVTAAVVTAARAGGSG
jgi:adenosylmethionine-8-amino-7-oxononanoate aminotransferase